MRRAAGRVESSLGLDAGGGGADKVPLVLYFGTREALSNGVRFKRIAHHVSPLLIF